MVVFIHFQALKVNRVRREFPAWTVQMASLDRRAHLGYRYTTLLLFPLWV